LYQRRDGGRSTGEDTDLGHQNTPADLDVAELFTRAQLEPKQRRQHDRDQVVREAADQVRQQREFGHQDRDRRRRDHEHGANAVLAPLLRRHIWPGMSVVRAHLSLTSRSSLSLSHLSQRTSCQLIQRSSRLWNGHQGCARNHDSARAHTRASTPADIKTCTTGRTNHHGGRQHKDCIREHQIDAQEDSDRIWDPTRRQVLDDVALRVWAPPQVANNSERQVQRRDEYHTTTTQDRLVT